MPTLPAIGTGGGTMDYAPLTDAPPSPNPNLVISRSATPTMSRQSTSSSLSSEYIPNGNGYSSTERQVYTPRQGSLSDETTPTGPAKGKSRMPNPIPVQAEGEGEGDVGDYRDKERERERKGKMRADGQGQGQGRKVWDEEQGRVEEIYGGGSYPPTNEEEDEERKIQENLARMAARDMARRRASRLSRQLSSSPSTTPDPNEGGFSSSTSYGRRPLSSFSLTSSGSGGSGTKRGSIMGLMDGLWPKTSNSNKGLERIDDAGELPLTHSHSRVSSNNPESNLTPYNNPYDSNSKPPLSPISAKSPFADPEPESGKLPSHARHASTTSEQGFSYSGPGWRGGAAVAGGGAGVLVANGYQEEPKEKWWHALCAWGNDLDGGHGEDVDGQAGRTNPME